MSKYKKQMWTGEGRGPDGFDRVCSPLDGCDELVGCTDQLKITAHMTATLKDWLDNPKTSVDNVFASVKKEWLRMGGSLSLFGIMQQKAFLDSGYYQNFKGVK